MHDRSLTFRADINGLRAFAVAMVVLYHFQIPGIVSGFVGVDVFFVISGYLMASIIVPKVEADRFSLTRFYAARIRRIFPALAVLSAALLVFGWHNLGPTDYAQLGEHAASAVTFTSNFIFRAQEGYFDAPSREKWLLHTWSLSTEAQFYLFFPLLMLGLRRKRPHSRICLLAALAFVSIALSIHYSPTEPAFTFYLLPARAWELLAGSLLFLFQPHLRLSEPKRRCLFWMGMAMITSAGFMFGDMPLWPSAYPLWPVIGTVFVLAARQERAFILRNPLAQALGRWSYSIYLWHWPLVVGFAYFDLAYPATGIALSILLGALSYYGIEQPCRRFGENHPRRNLQFTLAIMAIIAVPGVYLMSSNGLPARLSARIQQVDAERHNRLQFPHRCGFDHDTDTLTPCPVGDQKNIGYVLWGDSHAGAVASALRDATGRGILYYTHSCATLFDTEMRGKGARNHCRAFNRMVMEAIDKLPKNIPVVVANRYAMDLHGENEVNDPVHGIIYYSDPERGKQSRLYREHMKTTLCRIARDRRTYVMKPTPEIGFDVPRMMTRFMLNGSDQPDITLPLADYQARNADTVPALEEAAKACPNVRLIDPIPYLCPDGVHCMASKDGMPLYMDDDHLSERGNRLLLPMFKNLK